MPIRRIDIGIGIGALALGAFLLLVGIPYGIDSPRNMRSALLSPRFWPNILAVLMMLCGLILSAGAYRGIGPADEPSAGPRDAALPGVLRVAGLIVLVVAYYWLIPVIGMVWSSVLAFVALMALTRSDRPLAGLACAVVLPIVLFAFFYHVAGVAIPQSEILRLP